MVPPSSVISLPPARKRKSALEPTRVIVRSGNSNSAREFVPCLESTIPRDDNTWDGFDIARQERNNIDGFGDLRALEGLRTCDERVRDKQQTENPVPHRLEAEIKGEGSADIHHSIIEERLCRIVRAEVGPRRQTRPARERKV